jgi:hypothetical protein
MTLDCPAFSVMVQLWRTYMRVFLHKTTLSPYPREPRGVDLIQISLVGWRFECPIARPNDPVNFTKRTFSNIFIVVVDEPVIEGLGFTGCLSRWLAAQAKSIDGRNFFLLFSAASLLFLTNARKFSTFRGCATVWLGNSILSS